MSALSVLNSRLSLCKANLEKLEATLELIAKAKDKYNEVNPKFGGLLTSSNEFVTVDIQAIYNGFENYSGKAIENIKADVLVLESSDEYYNKISELQSDVEDTYSQLCKKESEVNDEITTLNETIASLEKEIAEEEEKLSAECTDQTFDKSTQVSSVLQQQVDSIMNKY